MRKIRFGVQASGQITHLRRNIAEPHLWSDSGIHPYSVDHVKRGNMLAVQQAVIERARSGYEGVRVLVTGGASFIGSHLTEALVAMGARVVVADDLSSGRKENLTSVAGDVELLIGDLRDASFAERATRDMEIIFHLAAAHGGRGYIDTHPVECLNNLTLDHTVFAAAAKNGIRKIVYASTACTYPTSLQDSTETRLLLKESDANFDEPGKAFADGEYGWSKLMTEMQLHAFYRQYGIEGIACRIFTAYGERENESHAVIALVAKAIAKLDPYPVWGDGSQTRNFTYVGDTAAGLLLSGKELSGFDVMNVGSQYHVTINELMDNIFSILGWWPSQIERQLDKPVGVKSRAADITKSRELLHWSPDWDLKDGLRNTIGWYQETLDPQRLATLEQLLTTR